MGLNVLFHDTRLSGDTPTTVEGFDYEPRYQLSVDSTLETDFISRLLTIGESDTIDRLAILCHGWAAGTASGRIEEGFGLEFCGEDGLSIFNVDNLNVLGRSIEITEVFIYGCGAAHIATGTDGHAVDGNGHLLCSKIAQATRAYVTASTEIQRVDRGISGLYPMDMGEWEGLVVRYDPEGEIVSTVRHPSVWFTGTPDPRYFLESLGESVE